MDGGNGSPRLLQREALNELLDLGCHGTSLVFVFSHRSGQPYQAIRSVALNPTPQCPDRNLVFPGNLCQWNTIFEKGADEMKMRERFSSLRIG
jgi:hypothetical protein